MKAIKVRQGSSKTLTVEYSDSQAVSATLTVKEVITDVIPALEVSGNFSDGVAILDITEANTLAMPRGDYLYQVTIEYSDGVSRIFPDTNNCDDDCDLPSFVVCESLSGGVS